MKRSGEEPAKRVKVVPALGNQGASPKAHFNSCTWAFLEKQGEHCRTALASQLGNSRGAERPGSVPPRGAGD